MINTRTVDFRNMNDTLRNALLAVFAANITEQNAVGPDQESVREKVQAYHKEALGNSDWNPLRVGIREAMVAEDDDKPALEPLTTMMKELSDKFSRRVSAHEKLKKRAEGEIHKTFQQTMIALFEDAKEKFDAAIKPLLDLAA